MRLRAFVVSQSAVWIVLAVFLLAFPRATVAFFGAHVDDSVVVIARLLGAELTALAIVSYVGTTKDGPPISRTVRCAYALSNTLGFAVCIRAIVTGVFSAHGWIAAGLYFIYAAVFIIAVILSPRETP